MLRSAGGKIVLLAPESFDAYGTQMKTGQEHLTAGTYFDAEDGSWPRLSVQARRPHGVGWPHPRPARRRHVPSAAINLRELFVEHPELVGTKYDASLLPGKERVGRMMERLAELAAAPQERDSGRSWRTWATRRATPRPCSRAWT
jgi:hypothetical protein